MTAKLVPSRTSPLALGYARELWQFVSQRRNIRKGRISDDVNQQRHLSLMIHCMSARSWHGAVKNLFLLTKLGANPECNLMLQ